MSGGHIPRQQHEIQVVFDPNGTYAAFGRGDDDDAVARPEIHDEILRCYFGHIEHGVDQRLRCWHPDDILAGLADLRLIGFRSLRLQQDVAGKDDDPQRKLQTPR